jgi:ribonucleoside-diphosphate reductase alpha chain
MAGLEFLPNSPTLMNAGRELQQLSACFVLPVGDSMDSIFEALKGTALIHKSGGGTGFSFSKIRPANDKVLSTGGIASGPISFMKVFNAATEAVKQGGTRRGANMGILRVDHPDILDFISCKKDNNALNNFNISVGITEDFMQAVEKDEGYDLLNPRTKEKVKRLNAKEVFDLIVNMAWKNGEPGIIFLDRINRDNPTPLLGEIESTNPCGEQPLLPYEACNLGSVNLAMMVKKSINPSNGTCAKGTWDGGTIDYDRLSYVVKKSIHFLDNVIDMNKYPLPEIDKLAKGNRKVGLGVMGFADMLVQLGIPYNSDGAVMLAEDMMKFITTEARRASVELAKTRGVFPNYAGSVYDIKGGPKVRNAAVTTIAPTGTLSIIANCSSGIEPLFAISFVKTVMDKDELLEVNPCFKERAIAEGFYSDELMRKIAVMGGINAMDSVPKDVKRIFVTAHDISPEWHIKMQAAFQKYTDNAVSKTVNFPHNAMPADVEKVYMTAYRLGCKGVTIYRDGSREEQVLTTGKAKKTEAKETVAVNAPQPFAWAKVMPRPRPAVIKGETRVMKTGCGNLYVTINEDTDGQPFELFSQMGKAGGCAASQSEAISRLVSLALRTNISAASIVKQLKGISCHSPAWEEGGKIFSCSDAIAKALERYLNNDAAKTAQAGKGAAVTLIEPNKAANKSIEKHLLIGGACPDCGSALEHESGCAVCRSCGFSKCS